MAVSGEPVLRPAHDSSVWAPEARGQTWGHQSDADFCTMRLVSTPRRTLSTGGSGRLSSQSRTATLSAMAFPVPRHCVLIPGAHQRCLPSGDQGCADGQKPGATATQHRRNGGQHPQGPPPSLEPALGKWGRSPGACWGCQVPLIPALLQALPACPNPAGCSLSPSPFLLWPHNPFLTPSHPRSQQHLLPQMGLRSAPSQLSAQTTVDKWVIKAKTKKSIQKMVVTPENKCGFFFNEHGLIIETKR